MIKRLIVKAAVLIPVFVAALLFFNWQFNSKNQVVVLQMAQPTLPTVSFNVGDHEINTINGYAKKMDIPSVRDTITPTEGRHTVSLFVHPYENTITGASLKVYDISGERVLENAGLGLTEQEDGSLKSDIQFDDSWSGEREAVMEIVLERGDKDPVYFYSRVTRSAGVNAESAVAFCIRFCNLTRDPAEEETIKSYLETDGTADNGTFHFVDMHCSVEQVMWNGLTIRNVSEPKVRITECNDVYTNMELSYSLEAGGVDDKGEPDESTFETYDVKEYYRVRAGFSHFYVLNFERTMNVRYDHQQQFLVSSGLDLGISDPGISISTSKDGNIIAYVTGDALWQYNVTDNTLKKIFSFRKSYDNDERDTYDAHEIEILDMSEEGSLTFVVSGYMNCGEYEGYTGTIFYYYDTATDLVEKLAYIPSDCSGERTIAEASRGAYYDAGKDKLYTIVNGTLSELNINTGEQQSILTDLDSMEYVVTADGKRIAYSDPEDGRTISVRELETGKDWQITSDQGAYVRLLGYIGEDLIVGYGNNSDLGYDALGNEIRPVSSIKIIDSNRDCVKEYSAGNSYILSCSVSGRLATVLLGTRTGNVYVEQGNDYISMNDSDPESSDTVSVETYQDGLFERCTKIAINAALHSSDATVSAVKILGESLDNRIEYEKTPSDKYYVFARTHLEGIYTDAGTAVKLADEIYGVVVMEDGRYLWERGNRDLVYEPEGIQVINMAERGITNALAACGQVVIDYMAIPGDVSTEMNNKGLAESLEKLAGQENCVELSSLTPDKLFYIINRNQPVIAITGENKGIVIFGYDEEGAEVYDPESGQSAYWDNDTLNRQCAAGGNQYLAIIR